jgi:hypothetical protein
MWRRMRSAGAASVTKEMTGMFAAQLGRTRESESMSCCLG